MNINLAAFTPPTNTYPPYASANLVNGRVELTVRSPVATADGVLACGSTSCISMSIEEFRAFNDQAQERLELSLEFMAKTERGASLRQRVYAALARARANGYDFAGKAYETETDLSCANDLLDCSDEFDGLDPAVLARYVRHWRVRDHKTYKEAA